VALSRDGRQVLSASLDHTLRLTDLRTGRAVHTLRDGGYACAPGRARACLSPRDDCAAAGAADGRVLVWGELDTASARLLATLAPPHAAGAAASVAWSDDGELVASAHADGSCCVWQR
jgi:WD40 repeat protein